LPVCLQCGIDTCVITRWPFSITVRVASRNA